MELLPTNDPQYKRAGKRGALLNTDTKALELYMQKRAEALTIKQLVQDVSSLQRDMNEIKELLRTLVSHD